MALMAKFMRYVSRSGLLSDARLLEMYPPFVPMRIKVLEISEGWRNVRIRLPLNALSRNPGDAHLVLDHLREAATQAPPVLTQLGKLRDAIAQPPEVLEREARRFTQRLALVSQACLMLRHASANTSDAFICSRFDPDWGPVTGISSGTSNPAALLREAWT